MPLFLQPGIPFICGSEQCTRSCCRAPQPVNVFRWDKPRKGRGPGYTFFHPILVLHLIFPSNNLKFSFQSLEECTSPASHPRLWLSEDCCPALLCPPGPELAASSGCCFGIPHRCCSPLGSLLRQKCCCSLRDRCRLPGCCKARHGHSVALFSRARRPAPMGAHRRPRPRRQPQPQPPRGSPSPAHPLHAPLKPPS